MPNLVHLSLSVWYADYIPEEDLEGQRLPLPEYNLVRRIVEPKFATIVSIEIGGKCISRDQLVCLLKVPDLRLASLNLLKQHPPIVDAAVINAITTYQTGIVHLSLNILYISTEHFNLLCRHLKKLITLRFYGRVSDSCGLDSFIYLKELRTLQIERFYDYLSNFPKLTILKRLLDKPRDIQLTHLDINFGRYNRHSPMSIDNAKECLRFIASRLLKLTFLSLSSCPLDENLFREITTNLVNLVVLRVEDCNISDDALTGLKDVGVDVDRPPLSNLKST
jgi:hypothetical protein